MTISNSFLVRIVADTELGRTAAATTAGSYSAAMSVPSLATPIARLDPHNPDGTDYPDCAGGTTTNGYAATKAWIWASKALFDTTTRRVLFVCSPHPADSFGTPNGNYNGYIVQLTAFDEADNDIHVYESPFSVNNATYPRSVGHAYDNQCLVDRTLYKMTLPLWPNATEGWVQPQIAKIDIDQVTDAVSSAREGEAYIGSISAPWEWDESALTWRNPGRNLTAGALDYLPGSTSLVFFHKKWLSFAPVATGTWTQPIDLEAQGYGFSGTYVAELGRITWPNHNVGHYNAASGKFVCGGGAYNPDGASNHRYQLDWISVDATTQAITKLDDSPVIMSVSETDMPTTEPAHLREAKVAACAGPNSVESLFFHDNGNVYGLNPFRPPGYQWRLITTLAFEVDLCVPIDDYGVVLLFTSGANGTASMRVYKPPVAGDHTPPSIPLDVAATATSSSEITLTWSASTDPVIQGDTTSGLSGYKVYRGGTLVATLGNVLTYSDTGLSAGTAYSYTVSAYDVAGNESEVSVADSATTEQAAGSYVATHFVAPYASVTDVNGNPAVNDYANLEATAPGSWARALNSNTPTTLGTAMANAVAGNKVRCAPGVYVTATSLSANTPGMYPTNSGLVGNPIVFFAQNPAAHNSSNIAALSEIRRVLPTPLPGNSGAALGTHGRSYIVFDGLYANESVTRSGTAAGVFALSGTGCEFRRLWVDRSNTPAYNTTLPGYNGNSIWVTTSIGCRIVDCLATGTGEMLHQNDSCFETYNSENLTIEQNTLTNVGHAIFIKTEKPALLPWLQRNVHVRYNRINSRCGIQTQTSQSTFIYQNEITAFGDYGIRWASTAEAITCRVVAYNNTILPSAASSTIGGIVYQGSMTVASGSEIRDNLIVMTGSGNGYCVAYGDGGDLSASINLIDRIDYNFFYSQDLTPRWLNVGNRTDLAQYKQSCIDIFDTDAYGYDVEAHSQYGTVTFQAGTYKLAANGQAALFASSTGGPVGCYITGTEEIGVRANPSY